MKFFTVLLIVFTTFLACEKASLYEVPHGEEVAYNSKDTMLESNAKTNSIAFIAGFDEDENTYYTNATRHFKKQQIPVVENLYSLDEIIAYINESNNIYKNIHIISHSNPWAGIALKISKDGNRITVHNLDNALNSKSIPVVTHGVDEHTNIIFHSCGLGENTELTKLLKQAFTNTVSPQLIASPYFNVFGGNFVPHYLAKPYYVSYPTGHSPGPLALSEEMKTTYPKVTIDWNTALTTRKETTATEIYSYRFNVPVEWEFTFEDVSEIPSLKTRDDIMDFVSEQDEMAMALYELGIPLEKYRWIIKISEEKKTLLIKGKTTILCVLDPIENSNDAGNYAIPEITNENLYTVF